MIFGLALVVLFVIAASYFAGRAVSRELAAATLQTDFVSAVSHEFRTPLTSMKQFTEMLVEDDDLPAEERRTYYRAQERATRRLFRLVESLLDIGRMEAGACPHRREPRTVLKTDRLRPRSNSLAWAIRGSQLVYSARSRLWTVPAGGEPTAISTDLDGNIQQFAVSPDRRTIAFNVPTGGDMELWRMEDFLHLVKAAR